MHERRPLTALINPAAGGGRGAERWAAVAAHLTGTRAEVVRTASRGHTVEAAHRAAARGHGVVAVGGDGMVRDVAAGVVAAGAGAIGIVPAGRGNDLAGALGYPSHPAQLADLLAAGHTRRIDVLDVAGRIVPGNVYAGVDALANDLINRWQRLPDLLLYRLAPLRAIAGWRAPRYTLAVDGATRTVRAHTVVIANSGRYGHGLRIVPPARLDDGLMHVLVVGDGPRHEIVRFMRQAGHGRHLLRPEVSVYPAREVGISADRPLPAYADGDPLAPLPITVRVLPGALRVFAGPPG